MCSAWTFDAFGHPESASGTRRSQMSIACTASGREGQRIECERNRSSATSPCQTTTRATYLMLEPRLHLLRLTPRPHVILAAIGRAFICRRHKQRERRFPAPRITRAAMGRAMLASAVLASTVLASTRSTGCTAKPAALPVQQPLAHHGSCHFGCQQTLRDTRLLLAYICAPSPRAAQHVVVVI